MDVKSRMIWSEEQPKIDQNAEQVYSHPQNLHSHALLSKSTEICLPFRCSNFWKSYWWQLLKTLKKWTPLDTAQALAISSFFAANTHFFSLSRRGGVCVYCSIIVLSVLTSPDRLIRRPNSSLGVIQVADKPVAYQRFWSLTSWYLDVVPVRNITFKVWLFDGMFRLLQRYPHSKYLLLLVYAILKMVWPGCSTGHVEVWCC